jgi:hypothetical protein
MKSKTLPLYKKWLKTAPADQVEFVDSVYAMCEEHYEAGGDGIVECWEPGEIVDAFKTLDDVRSMCGLTVEQALNARWGEDDDPELKTSENFKDWKKEPLDG